MSGYVYLIGTNIFKWYKIGKSIKPQIRVNDLGILLPFKIKIYGIWKAENHSLLEQALHEKYNNYKINGEWFHFQGEQLQEIFTTIPEVARIYPNESEMDSAFESFSNIEQDSKDGKKVLGVRAEKLRGNFTQEERQKRREDAITLQKKIKDWKKSQLEFDFTK